MLSLAFSWRYDFQPQGRYLFPIVPALFYAFSLLRSTDVGRWLRPLSGLNLIVIALALAGAGYF
jgi:hypothetical protein